MVLIMVSKDEYLRNLLMKQTPARQEIVDYMAGRNLVIAQVFLIVCMLGGYLLIRHMLVKRASQQPE